MKLQINPVKRAVFSAWDRSAFEVAVSVSTAALAKSLFARLRSFYFLGSVCKIVSAACFLLLVLALFVNANKTVCLFALLSSVIYFLGAVILGGIASDAAPRSRSNFTLAYILK